MSVPLDLFKYSKNYKFQSLLIKNLILVSLLTVIPLVLISASFITFLSHSFYSKAKEISMVQNAKTEHMIDRNLSELNRIGSKLTLNDDIINFMYFSDNLNKEKILTEFKYLTTTFDYIDSIMIFSELNNSIISSKNMNINTEQLKNIYSHITDEKYLLVNVKNENYYTDHLTLIKPIYLTDSKKSGALFINISIYNLNKVLNPDNSNDSTYILDSNGEILCGKDSIGENYTKHNILSQCDLKSSTTATVKSGGISYIVCAQPSAIQNMKYVLITSIDSSFAFAHKNIILITALLTILMDILVSFLITIKTYQPIYNILDILDDNYDTQTQKKTMKIKTSNEITHIINSLEKLNNENLKISHNLNDTLNKLNQMHYMLIHSQISSHFLSNTIQAISFLAYDFTQSENNVTLSLKRLSDLYRSLTDTDSFLISLSDEFDYTKKYLELMKLKYENTFTVTYDIDDDILNTRIPKLCLQPIVENSFRHGFDLDSTSALNKLTISAHKKNSNIEITVTDNGIGMTEEILNNLQVQLNDNINNQDNNKSISQIGLININKRLKLVFGSNFGISVDSEFCIGTTIHILLPPNVKSLV